MSNIPHIIEAALLLLIFFLVGCVIGWVLRAKIFKPNQVTDGAEGKGTDSIQGSKAVGTPMTAVSTAKKPKTVAQDTAPAAPSIPLKTQPSDTSEKPGTPGKPKQHKPALAAVPDEKSATATQKPDALSAPRDGKADDLKKIKGVGPKLESTLNGLGIYHFDQIAQWTRTEIDWVDDYLSFKGRIDRDKWISQAEELKD